MKHFVHVKYDTQARQVHEMWQPPVTRRVNEGEAIADVEVVQATWNSARLRCRDNLSKFRPGDMLLLNQGDPIESTELASPRVVRMRGPRG